MLNAIARTSPKLSEFTMDGKVEPRGRQCMSKEGSKFLYPSSGASRHLLPSGEGIASPHFFGAQVIGSGNANRGFSSPSMYSPRPKGEGGDHQQMGAG